MSNIFILKALLDNYVYVIENNKKCCVIDPGESSVVPAFLKEHGFTLSSILLTHDHSDHIGGIKELTETFDLEVLGAPGPRFSDITIYLKEGDIAEVVGEKFEVIATPGHTSAHLVYYFKDLNALFSGDTLFAMGCGRLFEGSAENMFLSFQKLKKLPGVTKVYCGHEYTHKNFEFAMTVLGNSEELKRRGEKIALQKCTIPFTLEEEFATNPFFLANNVEEFSKYRKLRDRF